MTYPAASAAPIPADLRATTGIRSAAHHCAAAEELFARARDLHPGRDRNGIPTEAADEYERCLDWARMHLRLAEAVTAGVTLLATHRPLLAEADVSAADARLSHEAYQWLEFLDRHRADRRSA